MTHDKVIELAREVAEVEGWLWLEPIRAIRFRRWWIIGPLRWEVVSNADRRGMNVHILIDDSSGRIIEKGFLSR